MIFYLISPIGATSPGLYETFEKTFEAKGHRITQDISEATIVCFDSHSGYLPYDEKVLDIVSEKRLPVIWFDAWDYHCDSTKHWFGHQSILDTYDNKVYENWEWFYVRVKARCKLIYFMRKIQTDNNFPDWVHPFEYVQFHDHDFELTTKEELFSRPYDSCFIGCKSPRREAFINALLADGRLKIDYQWTEERIPHDEWLHRHRQAKFFIESDGGGLGSERPYQLMTIAPMLKQNNLGLIKNDWIDGLECVKIGDETGYIPPTDIEDLKIILSEPDTLYSIYLKGVEKLKTYFNSEYRANYILDTIAKHL